jgi:two-component system response regulator AtoC
MTMAKTLLIIEDEQLLGTELSRHYENQGWDVSLATSLDSAERMLKVQSLDPLVVLSDMSLPDGNTLDLLEDVRTNYSDASEWIFFTAYGTVPDSVRALRLGAFDFLEKPVDRRRLDLLLTGAARSARAQNRLKAQTQKNTQQYAPDSFIGKSAQAKAVRQMLAKLSGVPFSALTITGETGTGKGLVARVLHHSGSRAEDPLIEVNCAALPKDLMESELFGHEPGAFTGAKGKRVGLIEQANGGTLFLDEIGELDTALQAKLLKAIEDKTIRRIGGEKEIKVDTQIIAATNRDLESQVQEGRFRSDLYHRLNAFHLHLPSLCERIEDIEDLVPLFISEFNVKAGKSVSDVSKDAWETLYSHKWPGNVRELRNVIERCVLFADSDKLSLSWLQLDASPSHNGSSEPEINGDRLSIPLNGSMALDDMDKFIIKTALNRNNFNVTATARSLGTTRETLRYRIQKYGLRNSH